MSLSDNTYNLELCFTDTSLRIKQNEVYSEPKITKTVVPQGSVTFYIDTSDGCDKNH